MPGTWSIRGLGLLLAVFGLWAALLFPAEYRAAILSRLDEMSLTMAMLDDFDDLPAPASYRGQRTVMEACQSVAESLALSLQPEEVGRAVAQGCRVWAEEILATSPASALPHLVVARALLEDGDAEAGRLALRRAQAAAPTSGWLAERRVELALAQLDALDDVAREVISADIALLASIPAGSAILASHFVANEPARDLIASGVERAAGRDQRRFLDAIQAQGG